MPLLGTYAAPYQGCSAMFLHITCKRGYTWLQTYYRLAVAYWALSAKPCRDGLELRPVHSLDFCSLGNIQEV